MIEPYFDVTETDDPDELTDEQATAAEKEDEREGYRARARVLLSPGPDRADFVRLLDALNDVLAEQEDFGGAEAAADLASVIEEL